MSPSLSLRDWECFTRAAAFLLEYTLYKLIYLHLNNVQSCSHGIGSRLSLLSNKPVTATKKDRFFPPESSYNRKHVETEKTKGAPQPLRTYSSAVEATRMLNHPPPPWQVCAASLAQEISKGALKRDACRCLQRAPLRRAKLQGKKCDRLVWKHTQANVRLQNKPLFVRPSWSSLLIKSNNSSWNSCVSE